MYFDFISSFEPTNIEEYRRKVIYKLQDLKFVCYPNAKGNFFVEKKWIDTFAELGHKRTGYARERVTCYMHAAAYHIPQMVKLHKNIKQFSGQGTIN